MSGVLQLLIALMIMAGICPLAAGAIDQSPDAAFSQAVKAYHASKYDEAVKWNESILSQGYYSPALYYNLGNAYYKEQHLGKSILNYLRAQSLKPRDSDVRSNLSFARSMVENYAPWPSNPLLAPLQQFWATRELLWMGFLAFVLTGSFFLYGLYSGMRRKRLLTGVVLGIALIIYIVAAGVVLIAYRSGMGVCIQKVDARFEPNSQATVYFKIPEGVELKALRSKDDWVKVQRSDGKIGWVPVSAMERM
ncbi:MAG: SH3 domain-containing protein [Candidatus Omnitrophota bacterium]